MCLSLILRGRARLCDFIKTQLKKAKKSHSCLLYLVNETVTTSVLVFDDTHTWVSVCFAHVIPYSTMSA